MLLNENKFTESLQAIAFISKWLNRCYSKQSIDKFKFNLLKLGKKFYFVSPGPLRTKAKTGIVVCEALLMLGFYYPFLSSFLDLPQKAINSFTKVLHVLPIKAIHRSLKLVIKPESVISQSDRW